MLILFYLNYGYLIQFLLTWTFLEWMFHSKVEISSLPLLKNKFPINIRACQSPIKGLGKVLIVLSEYTDAGHEGECSLRDSGI